MKNELREKSKEIKMDDYLEELLEQSNQEYLDDDSSVDDYSEL